MNFFDLDRSGKREVFERTAKQTGRRTTVLEKDLWVCWVLQQLFKDERSFSLVFKGGTSLSKVYGAIDRFSEDVDVTIDKFCLGYQLEPEEKSKSKIKRELESVRGNLCSLIVSDYLPILSEGPGVSAAVDQDDPTTILLQYDSSLSEESNPYLKPIVRVEFGARNPIEPSESFEITCDVAGTFPKIHFPTTKVNVLSGRRTFWEKATLLHMLFHRDVEKVKESAAERQARHYYDIVALSRHEQGQIAVSEEIGLLERVANDKELLYPAAWARYSEARVGTLKLVPGDELREYLAEDYRKMLGAGMFGAEPPNWDTIIKELKALEHTINRLPRRS